MKNAIKVTLAYLAAVIGAGFASGSETVYYFVRFGNLSFAGVILTSVGFGFAAYSLMSFCRKYSVNSFENVMNIFCGKKISSVAISLMCVFMLILLGAMISAFAEMMYIIADAPKTLSALAFCIICYYILCMPPKKIVKWGGIAGCIIVVMIILCCFYMLKNRTVNVFSNFSSMVVSSAVYTSYNAFAVFPVLCEWSEYLCSEKECRAAGIMSGIMSFCALSLIWIIISIFYGKINLGEMPMLTIAARQGKVFMYVYVFVIFASVLSSAVANAYGVSLKFMKFNGSNRVIPAIVMCFGWFLSSLGFTTIVTDLYKYTGYAILILLMYCFIKTKKNAVFNRKIK